MSTDCSNVFREWALSYSGMDGGNPSAPLWICGIEFGDDLAAESDMSPVREVPCWTAEGRAVSVRRAAEKGNPRLSYLKWPYCILAAKLASVVLTGELDGWRRYYREDADEKGFCGRYGGVFCLNLFPITCRRITEDGWDSHLQTRTGFPSRHHYRAWCVEYRFGFLRDLARSHRPAAIVCPSAADTRHYSLHAFAHGVPLPERPIMERQVGRKHLRTYKLASCIENSSLWVVPFLGQGGVMSNAHVRDLGRLIRNEICHGAPQRLDGV